jgi:uncharacterized protein YdiU (UPF0061 family)
MRAKLELNRREPAGEHEDLALIEEWLALLQRNRIDFTLAWRYLADAAEGNPLPLRHLFADHAALDSWLQKWQARCAMEDAHTHPNEPQIAATTRAKAMRLSNPWLIPRNHCVEDALSAASDENDFGPFEQLLNGLKNPYEVQDAFIRFSQPAPASFTASYCTFCGT